MSGGHFDYKDSALKHEIFGWDDKCTNQFEDIEFSELVWDVLNLIHEYDWYICGDTNKLKYVRAKNAFKEKWFKNHDIQVQLIIDRTVQSLKDELYETFGFEVNELTKGE